jgi:hypothetical protein
MAVVERQRRVRTKGLENVELSWAAGQESIMSGQICGRSTRGMGLLQRCGGGGTWALYGLAWPTSAHTGSDDYFIPASAFVCPSPRIPFAWLGSIVLVVSFSTAFHPSICHARAVNAS